MKNQTTSKHLKVLLAAFFILTTISSYAQILKIHYLGHSAFVLEFDNGVTVVTDYGKPNAWVQSGWNSPIESIGDLVPDVMTFSHQHADHYDSTRIPFGVKYILTENDSLQIQGLHITPIRVCENNVNVESSTAFLFSHKEFQFLHLSDAQAQIIEIENSKVAEHIKKIIPDSLDLMFMTIEGQTQFVNQAELFIDLVKPKRIIPMHYWSNRYKNFFIQHLALQNNLGKHYSINQIEGAKYEIDNTKQIQPVEVIDLKRGSYNITTGIHDNAEIKYGFNLEQNYPNPFNPTTIIEFTITSDVRYETHDVRLVVYNSIGEQVATLVNEQKSSGNYRVPFYADKFSSGIYYYSLRQGDLLATRKMVLLK